MHQIDSRGAVRAFRYRSTPMTEQEQELLAALDELDPEDRELIQKLIRHLAALRNPQK